MNWVLFWLGLILFMLWPLSFGMAFFTCLSGVQIVCIITATYALYGWIPSIIGMIMLIIGIVLPSPASSNVNKKRPSNQELEGGRRRK